MPKPIATAAAIAAVALLAATAAAASGNVEAGRAKATAFCAACHGPAGFSDLPLTPHLAGNMDGFLQWQLVFYRGGRRHDPNMDAVSADLTDEEVRDLGAYYASLPPDARAPPPDPSPALTDAGRALTGTNRCAACHTDDFGGKSAAPRLARQREDYLVKALGDYRSGARPSTGVAAMTEAASRLSDDEIAAIAHFLAYLPPAP
jgi:cytochrome c553